tara:strand:- start:24948 stop:25667 length:720 start_codon:yes stop_codon:yes gene_type:complete
MKPGQLLAVLLAGTFCGVSLAAPPDYSTRLEVVDVPADAGVTKPRGFLFFGRRKAEERANRENSVRRSLSSAMLRNDRTRRNRSETVASDPRLAPDFKVFVRRNVLAKSTGRNSRVEIDLAGQRAYLLVNGEIGLETPISSARSGKYTPTGTFTVHDRVRSGKISNLYDVLMPYWQRLGSTEFGIHAGYLPGRPASAGCVRLPRQAAELIFDHTAYGTQISIHSSWSPESGTSMTYASR